ncbi:MAG TPA: ABC transporter ATP-binding protein [Acidimicrobiia bacterium]|nr:ABC transporter ATP-binding protein [Acidimicrobiia bacterium]
MTEPPVREALVRVRGLTKRFDEVTAVAGVDLDVFDGELLALLGPSGCGKTTAIRLLAGFERPDAGTIAVGARTFASPDAFVPPERRNIGVVFQDYALFPHMRVLDNVGYGIADRRTRRDRSMEMLELVGLADKGERMPHELSGGEQQRVAIARALAPGPTLLLLDEPFSNLDAALRTHVRSEVREILRAAGATSVFVTHDQEEALSMADRIAVMQGGHLLQVGTPAELYARPDHAFVASFVGDADVLPGVSDGAHATTVLGVLPVAGTAVHGSVDVVVRPENVRLRLDGSGGGDVRAVTFYGHDQVVDVALTDGSYIRARTGPQAVFLPGDRVAVQVVGPVVVFAQPDNSG